MATSNSVSPELKAKLKDADLEVQAYVDALQSEIKKIFKEKGALQVGNMLLNERIDSLSSELEECLKQKEKTGELDPSKLSKESRTKLSDVLHEVELSQSSNPPDKV